MPLAKLPIVLYMSTNDSSMARAPDAWWRKRANRGVGLSRDREDERLLHQLLDLLAADFGGDEAHVREGAAHGGREELVRGLEDLERLRPRHARGGPRRTGRAPAP